MSEDPPIAPGSRIQAIDIIRGLVIVIMALDHVRDYLHDSGTQFDPLDANLTTPLLYCTRWITNFCRPTFVFLAGVSIWLQAAKGKQTGTLSGFLLTRGLWIVFLELTVINFGWSFSIPYFPYLQVMWAIGWSMVVLAGFVWLPRRVVLGVGIAIVAGHNLLDAWTPAQFGEWGWAWMYLHQGGMMFWKGSLITYAYYPLLPWVGLMLVGYGLGTVFLSPRRDRVLLWLGLSLVALFFVLRGMHWYGDPGDWKLQADGVKTAMTFFNVQKYPPSLLYVCATVGPMLLLLRAIEGTRGPVVEFFRTFGAVPMMAYVSHIYVAHAFAIGLNWLAGHPVVGLFNWIYLAFLEPEKLKGMGLPLWMVYPAWIAVVATIYPLCRWWGGVKRRRRDWWLSYL